MTFVYRKSCKVELQGEKDRKNWGLVKKSLFMKKCVKEIIYGLFEVNNKIMFTLLYFSWGFGKIVNF